MNPVMKDANRDWKFGIGDLEEQWSSMNMKRIPNSESRIPAPAGAAA